MKVCNTVPEQKPHVADAISNAAESHIWLAIYKQKVCRIGKQASTQEPSELIFLSPCRMMQSRLRDIRESPCSPVSGGARTHAGGPFDR